MSVLQKVGIVYFLAVANFFYQSNGFVKFFDDMYPYWKCIPLLVLISFMAVNGGGVPIKTRALLVIALIAGCIGDYFIGIEEEGIVPGAVAFGIGHIVHMMTYAPNTLSICWPLAAVLIAWNAVIGHFCILPMLSVSVLKVVILSVYGLILLSNGVIAASQYMYGSSSHSAYSPALKSRFLGFAIFIISDNCLILDHTGFHIPHAELIVLCTYFTAQYMFVRAAVLSEKLKSNKKKLRK